MEMAYSQPILNAGPLILSDWHARSSSDPRLDVVVLTKFILNAPKLCPAGGALDPFSISGGAELDIIAQSDLFLMDSISFAEWKDGQW